MEMEKLLGNSQYQNNPHLRSQKQPSKGKKKPIKIKYISSPMMVRANNASEFRAIVQELTGRNSNYTDLYDDVHHDESLNRTTTIFSESDHDQPGWSQFSADYHPQGSDDHALVDDRDHDHHVGGKFSNPNVSLLGQIDELGLFWRSEVSESFNGFQSSCLFVGQN
ncbi:hypothetical protein L484_024544 [Morus notabilis]|uniref:VQ domain-containing protein n=1 Tax=Morus notabilis TaxID=981085 RepID=W9RT96_9ROSA|nr:sigma factor binding protein 1, chloroplastic [Morus notabilis]EXB93205.1 hypothetical protein L484_024544 [Morus notabilis]